MPEGTGSGADNPQRNSDTITNPNQQNTQEQGKIDPRKEELRRAWLTDYTSKYGPTVPPEALQTIQRAVDAGYAPDWYTQSLSGGSQRNLPSEEEIREEQHPKQEEETSRAKIPVEEYEGQPDKYQEALEKRLFSRNPHPEDSTSELKALDVTPEEEAQMLREGKLLPDKIDKKDIYGSRRINCVEVLANEIMDTEGLPEFNVGGEFELLNNRGEFQPQNFLQWVRYQMMYFHGESPDTPWEFDREIQLKRDYNRVSLAEMLRNSGRYFRSWRGDHPVYTELVEQIKREIWLFGSSRSNDIKYRAVMGQDEQLAKTLTDMFYLNTFTKAVWDQKSSLYWVLTMPQHFKEINKAAKEKQIDNNIGKAITTAYLTYYNISDAETLREILGPNTPLLNPVRIQEIIEELEEEEDIPHDQRVENGGSYINPVLIKGLQDPDPKKREKAVVDFINIFNHSAKPPRIVNVVRRLLQEALAEQYDLYIRNKDGEYVYLQEQVKDEHGKPIIDPATGKPQMRDKLDKNGKKIRKVDSVSVRYAETFALSMARWTGAGARNDVNAVGFDSWAKLQHTDEYRRKQLSRTRGGALGNPYTVHLLKQLGTDFMNGTQVVAMGEMGERKILSHKTTLEVLMEMERASKESGEKYYNAASQLVFADNTQRSFMVDHLNRVYAIYSQVITGEEIKLEKFTKYDLVNGLTFDRGPFEEAVKEKFFKPMRYAWSTYAGINFAKEIRTFNAKTKEYETVHLGEAMFGREIFDIPYFWKPGKERISIKSKQWAEKIDWDKVNSAEGKVEIWRQVALARIAAELFAHRDRHSTDPKYNMMYYEQVIKALEEIPADILGDEFNMQSARATGSFFYKDNIDWLRKKAKIERWRLVRNAFFTDLLLGLWDTFKESKKIVKDVTK